MDWIEDISGIMADLEADAAILETVILNSKNKRANRYFQESILAINRALSGLSDALFEITTSLDKDYDI